MSKVYYQVAESAHVPGILEIYTPFIATSHTSFEEVSPTDKEMWNRISNIQKQDAWLVAMDGQMVTGYAYASPFRARKAYEWVREVSVYVHPSYYAKGIAGGLYQRLFSILELQGYRKILAGVALPNPASIRFHEKFGFTHFANFEEVGYKNGKWIDVGFWELLLVEERNLSAPKSINDIAKDILEEILEGGNKNE